MLFFIDVARSHRAESFFFKSIASCKARCLDFNVGNGPNLKRWPNSGHSSEATLNA